MSISIYALDKVYHRHAKFECNRTVYEESLARDTDTQTDRLRVIYNKQKKVSFQ